MEQQVETRFKCGPWFLKSYFEFYINKYQDAWIRSIDLIHGTGVSNKMVASNSFIEH